MKKFFRESANSKLGLYCHVPFCANKCSYCAFYQETPTKQLIDNYLWGIEKEFCLLQLTKRIDTIYFGGGTPGLLAPNQLEKLCKIVTENILNNQPDEFSIEFSPATVKKDKIDVIKAYGCNRITLGIQSFDPETLRALGRRQSTSQIRRAYDILASSDIKNVGIDLIFGIPGQSLSSWLMDLKTAIDLAPQHISTYNLTFEDDTKLLQHLGNLLVERKSEEEEEEFSLATWQVLNDAGYAQYEISNFCRPGFESRHNCNTWMMQDWIGIGPSACSQYERSRFSNPSTLGGWLQHLQNNALPHSRAIFVDDKVYIEDVIIFGLRMNRGINLSNLKRKYQGFDFSIFDIFFSRLATEGYADSSGGQMRLTNKGRLLADAIAREIIDLY